MGVQVRLFVLFGWFHLQIVENSFDSMVFLWLKIGKLCQDTVFFLIIITLHLHAFAQMVCVLCQQFRRVHHLQKG